MAKVSPFWAGAPGGMKRDKGREAMRDGSAWYLRDWLADTLESTLRKRGGWSNVSQDLSVVEATASYIQSGIVAPYSSGKYNLAFDEDGRAYGITSPTATVDIGAAIVTNSPVFYDDKVIVPHELATSPPKKITYTGSIFTVANLGGTPPNGKFAGVYKDVLWLASTSASADRIFFGTAGNPENTWDTANKYLDASFPITGMAFLANAVFIFSLNRTMRVRGSVPPPDSDFIVDDPIFDVGCTDSQSIVNYRDKVIWANASGLYLSDGTAMDDLTKMCEMKSWWREVMAGRAGDSTGTAYDPAHWNIVCGIYGDFLFYSIMNGSTKVDAGCIDMAGFSWYLLKNIDATCMWRDVYPDQLFFGRRNSPRVAELGHIFSPMSISNMADGNGTEVLPEIHTKFMLDAGVKTWRRLYVGYDIRDNAVDAPYMNVGYITSPESSSYTTLTPNLTASTAYTRVALPLDFAANGIAFKIQQKERSLDTRLYGMEIEALAREQSR